MRERIAEEIIALQNALDDNGGGSGGSGGGSGGSGGEDPPTVLGLDSDHDGLTLAQEESLNSDPEDITSPYNEGMNIKLARQLIASELEDDDEDADEEMRDDTEEAREDAEEISVDPPQEGKEIEEA